jgi:hypothetical protein
MTHPFPAEHDQQQAEALEILRGAGSFILIHFSDSEGGPCNNPDCVMDHEPHRTTSVIASCSTLDLHGAMTALGEEMMITQSIETLMNLGENQREQIASMLRHESGSFLKLRDDEAGA